MNNEIIKPNSRGFFPGWRQHNKPYDLMLGNGTQLTTIITADPDGGVWISVAPQGRGGGLHRFSAETEPNLVSPRLGLSPKDAACMCDFINDQIHPQWFEKSGRWRYGQYQQAMCMDFDMWPNIGTVSHATMRPEDLIFSFLPVLLKYAPSLHEESCFQLCQIKAEHVDMGGIAGDMQDWFDQINDYLNESLWEDMDRIAPPYTTFQASEGDGADFGYWPCHEGITEAIDCGDIYDMTNQGAHSTEHDLSVVRNDEDGYSRMVTKQGFLCWET